MSEVKRYDMAEYGGGMDVIVEGDFVLFEDFDRVTAERDALQQRLTAADERVDALDIEWSRAITERGLLQLRVNVLEGLLCRAHADVIELELKRKKETGSYDTEFSDAIDAALMSAEVGDDD